MTIFGHVLSFSCVLVLNIANIDIHTLPRTLGQTKAGARVRQPTHAYTHKHTHARTHTRTHTQTHAHARKHARAHTRTVYRKFPVLSNPVARAVKQLDLSSRLSTAGTRVPLHHGKPDIPSRRGSSRANAFDSSIKLCKTPPRRVKSNVRNQKASG